jgi:hypothetical protein
VRKEGSQLVMVAGDELAGSLEERRICFFLPLDLPNGDWLAEDLSSVFCLVRPVPPFATPPLLWVPIRRALSATSRSHVQLDLFQDLGHANWWWWSNSHVKVN